MKRFVRTEITTTCTIKRQSKVIDRDKKQNCRRRLEDE